MNWTNPSAEQVRSAYLRMAREYHPDRVPEHLTKLRADAEDKFKQVQEAWAVLGDPAKRRTYDLASLATPSSPSRQPPQPTHAPAARESIRGFLSRRQDLVKWSLLVLIATLILVVVGELVISRESNAKSDGDKIQVAKSAAEHDLGVRALPERTSVRHTQTWRGEGGNGLDVQIVGIAARSDELELRFGVRTRDHGDLLLYEPPGATGQIKKNLRKRGYGGSRFWRALRRG